MHPWSIYIDVEGFGGAYPNGDAALNALRELMRAVHRVGSRVYPEAGKRLFAYQVGDGFLIRSDFPEQDLERAVAIAVVLMRYVSATGLYCRAAIAEGELADIVSCYPEEVLRHSTDNSRSSAAMGEGLMTIYPVMGTALINAVVLDKRAPRGPLLSIDPGFPERLSEAQAFVRQEKACTQVDWVHMETDLIRSIASKAGLLIPSASDAESRLSKYLASNNLPEGWAASCAKFLNVFPSSV